MKRNYEIVEGVPGEQSPDSDVYEEHQTIPSSDIEQAVKIMLGLNNNES